MESGQVLDIAVLLLHYQMENQANNGKKPASHPGLVRMCAFIMHSLSTDRRFAVGLNTKFNGNATLPPTLRLPAFSGSYADFLIIVSARGRSGTYLSCITTIHAIISKTQNRLAELPPTYLTVISNVSPYLKNVSVVSSNKLVQLLAVFSSPRMLLADEENHLLLRYMLEPFDCIIRYQLTDNPHLVYALLRAQKRFEAIASFTLETALDTMRRAEAKSGDAGLQTRSRELVQDGARWCQRLPTEGRQRGERRRKDDQTGRRTPGQPFPHALGLIPAQPPAFPRKFAWNHPVRAWLTSYLWGVIFVGNRLPFGMWNGTRIALFAVKTTKRGKP
ncbi:MAG: high-temperature-induced dauer-formation protein-domain-containing protein [Olpidium bornovanus]|uniref:High-temperature-induced dauer-formation protein-domain-containing protein n=1 Tax=Olpidium bornovanus TaxID=278681 RepID=A0A8H7ZZ99_9FUNG|nr:MAG: high-temperature-induced dauer-formation protein-domain-containing protein [Olpidium bornovanus]